MIFQNKFSYLNRLAGVSLLTLANIFMAQSAFAQTTLTLDQPSAIPNGLKICDITDTYCIDIVADLSNPGARLPRTISVAGTGEFEDRQDDPSEHTKLDYTVSSTNSAGGAAVPFRFDSLSLIGINSLTDGANDSRIRDSYTFIEGGAWSVDNPASGEIHGASVSINTAAPDDVGSFVILDAEGDNDLNDIGSFTIATALGAGNGSEVFLNMENGPSDVEDGHNATYTFATPQQNTASLIVFNSGGRRMGWAYNTQLQVSIFVPELTSTKSFGTPVANADGTFSVPVTILVENTGETLASPLQIRDQLDAVSNFGSAFQAVTVPPTLSVTDDGNVDTAVAPSLNTSTYDGSAQPLLLSGSDGLLGIDDTLEVNFTVLLDPDAPGAPANLQNVATVSAEGPLGEMLLDETIPPGASSTGPTPLTLPTLPTAPPALPPLNPGVCGGVLAEAYLLDGMGIGGEQSYQLASGSSTHDPDVFFGTFGTEPAYTKNADGSVVYYFDGEAPAQAVSTDVNTPTAIGNISSVAGSAADQTDGAEFWRITARIDGVPGETYNYTLDNGNAHEFIHYWLEDSAGNVIDSTLGDPNTANGWLYGTGATVSTSSDNGATSISALQTTPVSYTIPASSPDGIVYLRVMVLDPQVGWGRFNFADVPDCPAPSLSMTKVADNPGPYTVGDVVTYTYTVANDGNQVVRDIAIADTHNGSNPAPVPGGETLLTDIAPAGDSTDAGGDGSWDVLAPGDVVTFTGTYTVTQTDAENL